MGSGEWGFVGFGFFGVGWVGAAQTDDVGDKGFDIVGCDLFTPCFHAFVGAATVGDGFVDLDGLRPKDPEAIGQVGSDESAAVGAMAGKATVFGISLFAFGDELGVSDDLLEIVFQVFFKVFAASLFHFSVGLGDFDGVDLLDGERGATEVVVPPVAESEEDGEVEEILPPFGQGVVVFADAVVFVIKEFVVRRLGEFFDDLRGGVVVH